MQGYDSVATPSLGRSATGRQTHSAPLQTQAPRAGWVAILLAAVLSGCATTAPPAAVRYMAQGEAVAPPSGFSELCRREPLNCRATGAEEGEAFVVALTPERRRLLEEVNRSVNSAIQDAVDLDLYGQEEFWINPLGGGVGDVRGDCEDYALAKRDLLIARGWPSEALFIAVGHHQTLGLHAVLVARTSAGDLVLDARSPWLIPFGEAPYVWVKRQLTAYSASWVRTHPQRLGADAAGATATTGRATGPRAGESR